VHAGECEVTDDDISGVAAHIGSRIHGGWPGRGGVGVCGRADLVFGSGVEFDHAASTSFEGRARQVVGSRVVADRREDQRPASRATPEQAALTPSPS